MASTGGTVDEAQKLEEHMKAISDTCQRGGPRFFSIPVTGTPAAKGCPPEKEAWQPADEIRPCSSRHTSQERRRR